MKNSNFSIPRNIRHASGIFLAKSLTRGIAIIMFAILCFCTIINPHDQDLFLKFLKVIIILIPTTFFFGYYFGRKDPKEIRKYLYSLKEKCNKQINSLENEKVKLHLEVDKEIELIKVKVKNYFDPLIQPFLSVKGLEKKDWVSLAKTLNKFNEKLTNINDQNFKKIGLHVEHEIQQAVFEAVSEKKQIKFDPEWIERVDFRDYRKEIFNFISVKSLLQEKDLSKSLDKINELIYDYSKVQT